MTLGQHFAQARKKSGLSQEEIGEKLGVSRQTISKWETDETLPDICQAKKLAALYHLSLDELIDFDLDIEEITQVIAKTSEEKQQAINWTELWGQKYPVLLSYPQTVDIPSYSGPLQTLLNQLRQDYGYSKMDALLVLKDILANVWQEKNQPK